MTAPPNHLALRLSRPGFDLALDLPLPAQGITVLYGASGSGKTTVLRSVAGLERAQGRVCIAGKLWQDDAQRLWLPTWQRSLGYVFQEASLFAHLSVQDNLQYGLKRRGSAKPQALAEAIALLGIGGLLSRRVQQLSGGERQRVAIARALATQPQLLLLDEPLSAIDQTRRLEIMPWLETLRDELRIPMLYVTHSPDEVARLADHLVVLSAGRVTQQGPAGELLSRITAPVLAGQDTAVLIEGEVGWRDTAWHLARVDCPGLSLWLRDDGLASGQRVRLRVLARDVSVATQAPQQTSIQNLLQGRIDSIVQDQHPAQALVRIECGAIFLIARLTNKAVHQLALTPGLAVWAQVKSVALVQ